MRREEVFCGRIWKSVVECAIYYITEVILKRGELTTARSNFVGEETALNKSAKGEAETLDILWCLARDFGSVPRYLPRLSPHVPGASPGADARELSWGKSRPILRRANGKSLC